jgi:hypothetical protein
MTILVTTHQMKQVSVLDTVKIVMWLAVWQTHRCRQKSHIRRVAACCFLLWIRDLLVLGQGSLITGKECARRCVPLPVL